MAIAIIIDLIYGLVLIYFLYIVASEFAFRFSKRKYKLIKREWRLLGALLEDFDEVTRSGIQITQKASTLLDSGPVQAGLTIQLNDKETGWITNARKVVTCVQSFRRLRKRRQYPMLFFYVLVDLVPMIGVALGMKWLTDVLGEKKLCADICRSLEQTSSKVRSLQDRSYVDEVECISVNSVPPTAQLGLRIDPELIISSVRTSVTEKPEVKSFIMHLQLLQAFMKDLRRLKVLESKREESWVIAANKTLEKAKGATKIINKAAANQRRSWLSDCRNWRAGRKLNGHIMYFDSRISGLLETKERYGFKFVKRDSSLRSAVHRASQRKSNQYQITDDKDLSDLNSIRNRLIQLPKTSNKVVSHVSSLSKELEHMHKLLEDTKATEYAGNFRNSCLEQLKKMVCEAERYSITHMEDSDSEYLSEIQRITDAVILLQQCVKVYSIEVRKESCSVVGFDEDIHKLVQQLTANSELHIISIGGMKGIGKTTLAKKVYHHGTIASHFKVRRWVSIPHMHNENALLRSVGSQIVKSEEKWTAKDFWIKNVRDFLKEKRYLLVLDNVPSKEVLDSLKAALFPEMMNGSKVVLTTNSKALALHVDTDQNSTQYPIRLRTQEESWEFFTQMVHIYSDQEETNAKKLVARTGGLPLVILRLGYLLSRKKVTAEELSRLLDRITHGRNQTPWLDTLALNKKDLQEGHFELFPGEFEIPARRLVASWIAKGLVAEDFAFDHLLDLINRCMIQVVERKPNGDVKTCRLPSALRELWLQDKGNSSKTCSWSQSTSPDQQLIAYHFDDNDASFSRINGLNMNTPNVLQNGKYPQSILFFDTREGNKPGEEIGYFLRKGIAGSFFQQLLVLDLERVFRPQLPTTIGKLKKLKYLGLRWTYLEEMPASIGNLVELQTLDLKHTRITIISSSIWKLKNLRHLYLNENCRIKFRSLTAAISMRELKTLSGVFLDKGNLVKDRLDKLTNLRKLGLTFQLTQPEQKVIARWIVQLNDLESLKLASINEKSAPQLLRLKPLLRLKKLSTLYLSGKLENPSIELPESLIHLTLSASGIVNDPMPKLGKLPNLKSLALNSDSYQGTDMVCSVNDFPQLFVLKLWKLDTLKRLVVQEGAMRNLRELEIRSCRILTSTSGLTHLKILQELKLTNMPNKYTGHVENDFAEAVLRSAGKAIHCPAIKIDNW
ncbi:putative inactive disease susceptibility protein LOV1 [Rosa rugosa]|uniref:putative inactive disease susceptibility protein LOV1 n=1 Tax=Rosa rugosa TaxID=74645 RepID=UPI002B405689|nr:putative inactive disease susceptibility protein LOV1 [Rosa rugosa]